MQFIPDLSKDLLAPDLWDTIQAHLGDAGGVYFVTCFEPSEESVIPVNRLLGSDKAGILYIGKADSFALRVIDLKKSTSPDHISQGHGFGVRYKRGCDLNPSLRNKFQSCRLQVSMIASRDPLAAEREALSWYLSEFGELPPFNRREDLLGSEGGTDLL